jgi:hypothetical protein
LLNRATAQTAEVEAAGLTWILGTLTWLGTPSQMANGADRFKPAVPCWYAKKSGVHWGTDGGGYWPPCGGNMQQSLLFMEHRTVVTVVNRMMAACIQWF